MTQEERKFRDTHQGVKGMLKLFCMVMLIAARNAQVPMGHMGDAWDVAHAALFLASDEARYVTGTELIVDGRNNFV